MKYYAIDTTPEISSVTLTANFETPYGTYTLSTSDYYGKVLTKEGDEGILAEVVTSPTDSTGLISMSHAISKSATEGIVTFELWYRPDGIGVAKKLGAVQYYLLSTSTVPTTQDEYTNVGRTTVTRTA